MILQLFAGIKRLTPVAHAADTPYRQYGMLIGNEMNANAANINRILDTASRGNYAPSGGSCQMSLRTPGKIVALHGECAAAATVGTATFTLNTNACAPSTFCFADTTLTCTIAANTTTCDATDSIAFDTALGIQMRFQTSSDYNGNTSCSYAEYLTQSDGVTPYNTLVRWNNIAIPAPPTYGGTQAQGSNGTLAQAEMVMPWPGGNVGGISLFRDNPNSSGITETYTVRDETDNVDIVHVDLGATTNYRGIYAACTANCFIPAGHLWDVKLTQTGTGTLVNSDRHVAVDFTGIGAIMTAGGSAAATNNLSSPASALLGGWTSSNAPKYEFKTTNGGTLQNMYVVADGNVSTTIQACVASPPSTTCSSTLQVGLSTASSGNDTTDTISAPSNVFFKNLSSTGSTFIRAAAELVQSNYVPPPTVTSVTGQNPQTTAGGYSITINGTSFTATPTVTVGGTAATGVTWVSATQLTATAPAQTAGTYDVVVTNPDAETGTCTNCMTYIAPPVAPTIGTPSAQSASSIRWNFTDNASDEIGFRVYDNLGAIATSSATANLSYLDETGLACGTSYSGRYVKAYNSYGESTASAVASSQSTNSCPGGSSRPTVSFSGGVLMDIGTSTIKLSWQSNNQARWALSWWQEGVLGAEEKAESNTYSKEHQYTVFNLEPETTYSYLLQIIGDSGEDSYLKGSFTTLSPDPLNSDNSEDKLTQRILSIQKQIISLLIQIIGMYQGRL